MDAWMLMAEVFFLVCCCIVLFRSKIGAFFLISAFSFHGPAL
jgi:hypothetical protein